MIRDKQREKLMYPWQARFAGTVVILMLLRMVAVGNRMSLFVVHPGNWKVLTVVHMTVTQDISR